jgi:hypothetical protein
MWVTSEGTLSFSIFIQNILLITETINRELFPEFWPLISSLEVPRRMTYINFNVRNRLRLLQQKDHNSAFIPSFRTPLRCALNLFLELNFLYVALEYETSREWSFRMIIRQCQGQNTLDIL